MGNERELGTKLAKLLFDRIPYKPLVPLCADVEGEDAVWCECLL